MKNFATALTLLLVAGIGYIGFSYLLDPLTTVTGFGLPSWPQETAFYKIKGVRDLALGLVPLALLVAGQRRALGWALIAIAFVPLSDAVIVLSYGGSAVAAFAIHAATAVAVLLGGYLNLRVSGISQVGKVGSTA